MAAGATVWWWVVPPAQQNDTTRPANAVLISTPNTGALFAALDANGTGTWNGKQVSRFQGPFNSEAEARAASRTGGNSGQVIAAGLGAAAGTPGNLFPGIDQGAAAVAGGASSEFNALGDIAAALKAFYSAVTDAKMWRSLAWIWLGAGLMLTGILLWLRIPQRAAGAAARAAVA